MAKKVKMGQEKVNKGKREVTKENERQFIILNTSVVEKNQTL